jgi:hypothetical protein
MYITKHAFYYMYITTYEFLFSLYKHILLSSNYTDNWSDTSYKLTRSSIIHLLHAGEGNMKIYSPKSIMPEGNMILVGE